MAAGLTIDLGQLSQFLEGEIRQITQQKDFTVPLKRCRLLLISDTKKNFSGSHAPDGTPWQPLQGYRVRGGTGKPLRDRGLLLASVTASGAAGNIDVMTPTSLQWGTNREGAATHQWGATIYPKNARALAIPVSLEAMRAGSPRNIGLLLALVWKKGESRGMLVGWQMGKGKRKRGKTVVHYLLVPKVTIPQREFLGWNPQLLADVDSVFAEWAEKKLGG